MRAFLSRHCSPTTMERLVDPILTDIRIESAAASARGQHWTSRMIRAAGTISLLKALTLQGWTSFWSIQKSSAEDRRLMSRAVAYTVVATSVGVLLLVLPLLRSGRTQSLVPVLWDALPIALPFALFVGLVYGFKSSVMSRRSLAAAVALSVFCSMASITVLGWVAPLASKAFRMRAGSSFLSSPSEVTLGEFRTRIAADGRYTTSWRRTITLAGRWRRRPWCSPCGPSCSSRGFHLIGGFWESSRSRHALRTFC